MYNKIASIILNSGKNLNYAGEVFVSQPDANKERLAGKIFVLAEIEGKKNETQKIINFLINIFDYNYYGDEKILLRDKIEELKIENIFEAVLARVNQGLVTFLQEAHFKINPETTNLTLGVIHENKLYFSSYGKNKAFLIFRRQGNFEMLNIESNINEEEADSGHEFQGAKIFSAVINGEIPPHSYFLFTNEALPEYLSNRELIGVITKLPPMVAAEQIKNILQKINSFAPFLGIIVKSTLASHLQEIPEIIEEGELSQQMTGENSQKNVKNRKAHSSISHLNYTEQKTENMLAPAGIINLKKIINWSYSLLSGFNLKSPENKKILKLYEDTDETIITQAPAKENRKIELVRRESFLIKDKLIFRKQSYNVLPKIAKIFEGFAVIFLPHFWKGVYHGLGNWFKTMGKKDKILAAALAACFLILIVSIVFTASGRKNRLISEQFNQTINNISNKQAQIDLYLAVGNNQGASETLNSSLELLKTSLPQNKEQELQKTDWLSKLADQSDRIQRISRVGSFQEIVNTSSWNVAAGADNLVLLGDKLYIGDALNKAIYNVSLKDATRNQIALSDNSPLSSAAISDSVLYYLSGQKIIKVNGQSATTLSIGPEKLQGDSYIQLYNGVLYLLNKTDKQIYKYKTTAAGFSGRSAWLKSAADLSLATDFKIDGKISVSQSDGDLLKFNKGLKLEYRSAVISPEIRADKIIITLNNVYLLDLVNGRLINLSKDGALIKQYRLNKDNLKDFAIDEPTKSAYILAGTSVYKFGL